jgi:hypothetical protein
MQGMNNGEAAPTVSVVLSVKNGAAGLPQAVETILRQSFSDFELIAINNGSTDDTAAYLDSLADPRVRVFHQADAGLAGALNRGISLARGRYIARQDHDDLADRSRIEKQVAFLDAHPQHALVGTRAEIWVGDTPSGRFHDHAAENEILQFDLLFDNPFVHSSVMIRKSALDRVGRYTTDPARQPPEDYELWSRIAKLYRVANIPERLTVYREIPTSMSRAGTARFPDRLVTISSENLAHAVGAVSPERVHFDIAALIHGADAKLSGKPDAGAMYAVIAEAGRRFGGGEMRPALARRILTAKERLRRRIILRRPILGLPWRTARKIRARFLK